MGYPSFFFEKQDGGHPPPNKIYVLNGKGRGRCLKGDY